MKFQNDYAAHLQWADDLTEQVLKNAPPSGPATDRYRADLAGLLCTAYVAALECSVKAVFTSFARSKHRLLSNMTGYHFRRINGQIGWDIIAERYTAQFGEAYKKRFKEFLNEEEGKSLRDSKISIKETYGNLLQWRHAFAHEGDRLTTLEEVSKAFPTAKIVIFTLDKSMSS